MRSNGDCVAFLLIERLRPGLYEIESVRSGRATLMEGPRKLSRKFCGKVYAACDAPGVGGTADMASSIEDSDEILKLGRMVYSFFLPQAAVRPSLQKNATRRRRKNTPNACALRQEPPRGL